VRAQILTEGAIETRIIEHIDTLNEGDSLSMAMFYISDRDIVRALKHADERGVTIRLLFDPNKDAFGREKNGIPNRQVAHELTKHSQGHTQIRWCHTHGEQCHSKLLLFKTANTTTLIHGSANLTRRNLDSLNLETNILVSGPHNTPALAQATAFFEEQWSNTDTRTYSTPYETYQDTSFGKMLWYRWGEFTGLSRY
jgi:HKD family nuclease